MICKRYPGRRPSDYLHLDEWTGYQLDVALATRYEIQEKDFLRMQIHSIMQGMVAIMKLLGQKSVEIQPFKPTIEEERDEKLEEKLPTIDEALAVLGGKGTVIVK